jgi:hypothetical protein
MIPPFASQGYFCGIALIPFATFFFAENIASAAPKALEFFDLFCYTYALGDVARRGLLHPPTIIKRDRPHSFRCAA